jgi:hypothetical protein
MSESEINKDRRRTISFAYKEIARLDITVNYAKGAQIFNSLLDTLAKS